MDDKSLLIERLERLAIVFDELMPGCAELVRDAIAMLKEQETKDTGHSRVFQCEKCGYGIDDIFLSTVEKKYPIVPKYCPNCGRSVCQDD